MMIDISERLPMSIVHPFLALSSNYFSRSPLGMEDLFYSDAELPIYGSLEGTGIEYLTAMGLSVVFKPNQRITKDYIISKSEGLGVIISHSHLDKLMDRVDNYEPTIKLLIIGDSFSGFDPIS